MKSWAEKTKNLQDRGFKVEPLPEQLAMIITIPIGTLAMPFNKDFCDVIDLDVSPLIEQSGFKEIIEATRPK